MAFPLVSKNPREKTNITKGVEVTYKCPLGQLSLSGRNRHLAPGTAGPIPKPYICLGHPLNQQHGPKMPFPFLHKTLGKQNTTKEMEVT